MGGPYIKRAGEERKLIKMIRKRQAEFIGHIMRKEGLEEIIITGKIEGKRGRGRPRLIYLTSLSKWMQDQLPEKQQGRYKVQSLIRTCKDRKLWKSMVAYVHKGHGT